jgi:ribonuclease HI
MGWAWVRQNAPAVGSATERALAGSVDRDAGGFRFGTNQVAELCAVLEALRAHRGVDRLVIEADSEYAIHSSTDWLENWKNKTRPWVNAKGKVISNLELIQAIDTELRERGARVVFRWVRGHSGNPYNEIADQLALSAARSWQTDPESGIGQLPPEAHKINSVRYGADQDPNFQELSLF